jgi:hypothetical protein
LTIEYNNCRVFTERGIIMSLLNRLELEDYGRQLRSLTNLTKKLEKELQESRILLANLEDGIDQKTRFLIAQLEGIGGKQVELKIILGIIKNLKSNLLKRSSLSEDDLTKIYRSLIESEIREMQENLDD